MSYPDSVRYLYSLGNELKAGAKFGLDRMQALAADLAHPENSGRIVHVAGTNGKGSTCAMIASCLQAAGLRTGLYTSPHLIEPTERIQIDGKPVSPMQFAQAFETVHNSAERLIGAQAIDAHPSYFETVTAMALEIFRSEHCDYMVLEVGLGGRLDATNIVSPELGVITPISFDHEQFLGNTIMSIASEKAGILKPGVPVIVSQQEAQAMHVIQQRASELSCRVINARETIKVDEVKMCPEGSTFRGNGQRYEISLPGRHQIENARTAIAACATIGLSVVSVRSGLAKAKWPGRLEYVCRHPDVILDGAHNPAGAGALAAYIEEFFSDRPVWLVFGSMRDKALDEVIGRLFPLADRVIVTAPDFPRALRPEIIASLTSHPNMQTEKSLSAALRLVNEAPPNAAVFITGSLFLAGEARRILVQGSRN